MPIEMYSTDRNTQIERINNFDKRLKESKEDILRDKALMAQDDDYNINSIIKGINSSIDECSQNIIDGVIRPDFAVEFIHHHPMSNVKDFPSLVRIYEKVKQIAKLKGWHMFYCPIPEKLSFSGGKNIGDFTGVSHTIIMLTRIETFLYGSENTSSINVTGPLPYMNIG